jgi:putative DNA primase/helicase
LNIIAPDPFDGIGIEVSIVDPLRLAWLERSDLGNAERLKARAGAKLCHTAERGWVAYDGRAWSASEGPRLAAIAAHAVARALRDEADAVKDLIATPDKWFPGCTAPALTERADDLAKWSVTSGNSNKVAGMLAQAAHLMTAADEDFDRDKLALNVANGTLRFRSTPAGEVETRLDPHDPADLITRVASVAYDPAASCPQWERHLATCLPDPAVREFFQTVIGYTLSGHIREQCIFLLQGRGGDGKSTTMNVIRRMLGGFGATAKVNSFIATGMKDGSGPSSDMARLGGDIRLVSTGEPPKGAALDDSIIKTVTGTSPVVARKLHAEEVEYLPRWKLFVECNGRPRITGDDDGIWRRIVIIPWPHQFIKGGGERKGVEDELMGELPGILNWAIAGLKRWLIEGALVQPATVVEAVEDYRKSSNPFGEWMAERVEVDPEALTLSADLYADYKAWCEENGAADREVMSSTLFGRALGDKQFMLGSRDRAGKKRRKGLRLRSKLDRPGYLSGFDDMADDYANR